MLRIEWTEPVQFLNAFRGDSLRLAILRAACTTRCPAAVNASRPLRSSMQSIKLAFAG